MLSETFTCIRNTYFFLGQFETASFETSLEKGCAGRTRDRRTLKEKVSEEDARMKITLACIYQQLVGLVDGMDTAVRVSKP